MRALAPAPAPALAPRRSRAAHRARRVAPPRAALASRASSSSSSSSSSTSSLTSKRTNVIVIDRDDARATLARHDAALTAWFAREDEFARTARIRARDATPEAVRAALFLDACPRECDAGARALAADIADVARAFARIVYDECAQTSREEARDGPEVVLTLSVLRSTLCSKLHVDHTSARAMVSYFGATTEICTPETSRAIAWANALGVPGARVVCEGLKWACERLAPPSATGRCAMTILKGEDWAYADGTRNTGRGIVHRSPRVRDGEWRLTLKVDVGSYGKCCGVDHA
jgi:hypothetical protein